MPPEAVITLLQKLMEYPNSLVCKHYIAIGILNTMEEYKYHIPNNLVDAIIQVNDKKTLAILETFTFEKKG